MTLLPLSSTFYSSSSSSTGFNSSDDEMSIRSPLSPKVSAHQHSTAAAGRRARHTCPTHTQLHFYWRVSRQQWTTAVIGQRWRLRAERTHPLGLLPWRRRSVRWWDVCVRPRRRMTSWSRWDTHTQTSSSYYESCHFTYLSVCVCVCLCACSVSLVSAGSTVPVWVSMRTTSLSTTSATAADRLQAGRRPVCGVSVCISGIGASLFHYAGSGSNLLVAYLQVGGGAGGRCQSLICWYQATCSACPAWRRTTLRSTPPRSCTPAACWRTRTAWTRCLVACSSRSACCSE